MADYRHIFEQITSDPRYLANLDWGEARPGHAEVTVRAHIAEVERNLEALRGKLTEEEYWKLKILLHAHDSFKGEARRGVPISHPQSHASLAREFLARFCDDVDLLAMVQRHDEAFAIYRQLESGGAYDQRRFESLLNAIRDWDLFLAFHIIDGCTAGKSRGSLLWLFGEVAGRLETRFGVSDVLP